MDQLEMTTTTPDAHQLTTIDRTRAFILAGRAMFTLVSKKTGVRYTFRITQPDDAKEHGPWFVKVLTGADNTSDYQYIGCMWRRGPMEVVFKTKAGANNTRIIGAFRWFMDTINAGDLAAFEQVEVWHAGRCGRCGRTLTVPESIETGLGPVCAGKEDWS